MGLGFRVQALEISILVLALVLISFEVLSEVVLLGVSGFGMHTDRVSG